MQLRRWRGQEAEEEAWEETGEEAGEEAEEVAGKEAGSWAGEQKVSRRSWHGLSHLLAKVGQDAMAAGRVAGRGGK